QRAANDCDAGEKEPFAVRQHLLTTSGNGDPDAATSCPTDEDPASVGIRDGKRRNSMRDSGWAIAATAGSDQGDSLESEEARSREIFFSTADFCEAGRSSSALSYSFSAAFRSPSARALSPFSTASTALTAGRMASSSFSAPAVGSRHA